VQVSGQGVTAAAGGGSNVVPQVTSTTAVSRTSSTSRAPPGYVSDEAKQRKKREEAKKKKEKEAETMSKVLLWGGVVLGVGVVGAAVWWWWKHRKTDSTKQSIAETFSESERFTTEPAPASVSGQAVAVPVASASVAQPAASVSGQAVAVPVASASEPAVVTDGGDWTLNLASKLAAAPPPTDNTIAGTSIVAPPRTAFFPGKWRQCERTNK